MLGVSSYTVLNPIHLPYNLTSKGTLCWSHFPKTTRHHCQANEIAPHCPWHPQVFKQHTYCQGNDEKTESALLPSNRFTAVDEAMKWFSKTNLFLHFLFPIFQRQPPSKVPHPRFENTPQRWDSKEYPSTCLPWPNHPKYDQSLWRFAPICAHTKLSCSICQRPNFQHRYELHPVYPLRIWPIWHEWPQIEKVFGKEMVLECLSEIYI